jgi:Putative sensor
MVNRAGWPGLPRSPNVDSWPPLPGLRRRPSGASAAPWSPRTWRQALYLAAGIPVQLVALLVVLVPWWSLTGPSWGNLLGVRNWGKLWPLPLLSLVIVLLAVPALTAVHRQRLRATAEVDIPPQPATGNRWSAAGIVAYARSRATWRQLGYHLLAAPALAAAAIVAVGIWLSGIVCTLLYAHAWLLPRHGLLSRGQSWPPAGYVLRRLAVPLDVYLTVGGIVLLAAAPWLTAVVVALDARLARALLGPSRADEPDPRPASGGAR